MALKKTDKSLVAVIDDDYFMRTITGSMLSRQGFDVKQFETPKAFEQHYQKHTPNYKGIVSDMNFAGKDEKFAAERLYHFLQFNNYKGNFLYVSGTISEGFDVPILERTGQEVLQKGKSTSYFKDIACRLNNKISSEDKTINSYFHSKKN